MSFRAKVHSESLAEPERRGKDFLSRTHKALYYKPVYYPDHLETTYMRLFNKSANELNRWRRKMRSVWFQNYYTPIADMEPHLKKKTILITGGTEGIGFEVAVGLAIRGACVIIASSDVHRAARAVDAIEMLLKLKPEKIEFILSHVGSVGADGITSAIKHIDVPGVDIYDHSGGLSGEAHSVYMNLADLQSIEEAVRALEVYLSGRIFDSVILAASCSPQRNIFSESGHEVSFATNVLGPYFLMRSLIQSRLVKIESQVLMIGCDDYFEVLKCDNDVVYTEENNLRDQTYRESKLGAFWMALELGRHHPYLHVSVVHPGIVGTPRGREYFYGTIGNLNLLCFISARAAAQTIIVCAQYGSLMSSGTYYHNTCGCVTLDPRETVHRAEMSGALWESLEAVYDGYYALKTQADAEGKNLGAAVPTGRRRAGYFVG
jgi:NAD(P)-dependent dehydrogenase (short-subunit alcohol dehydrogenase family)